MSLKDYDDKNIMKYHKQKAIEGLKLCEINEQKKITKETSSSVDAKPRVTRPYVRRNSFCSADR